MVNYLPNGYKIGTTLELYTPKDIDCGCEEQPQFYLGNFKVIP